MRMDLPNSLEVLAAFEALRNQQYNLQETIGRLLELLKTLPEGDTRGKLLDEISALDVIAEVIKRVLDLTARPDD